MGPFKKHRTLTLDNIDNLLEFKMPRYQREIGWTNPNDSEGGIDVEETHDAQTPKNPRNPPGHRLAHVPVFNSIINSLT